MGQALATRAQRRLAAILAADMVGHSRLTGADAPGDPSAGTPIRTDREPERAAINGRRRATWGSALNGYESWSPDVVIASLSRSGSAPVLLTLREDTIQPWSGEQLIRLISGAVGGLSQLGVKTGDVVSLYAANSPAWVAVALACWRLGTIIAPIDSLLPTDDAVASATAAGARLLIADRPIIDADPAIEVVDMESFGEAPPDGAGPGVPIALDAPVALLRTSGTTGTPKLFHLTLGNIGANIQAIAKSGLLTGDDRVLMPLPMHHIYPWVTATLTSLTVGATLVLPESPTGPHIATALRLVRPTVMIGVPRLYEALVTGVRQRVRGAGRLADMLFGMLISASMNLRKATRINVGRIVFWPLRRQIAPGLRMMVSGGANVTRDVADAIEAMGWDLRSGYGLAETASIFTGNLSEKRLGTEGKPITDGTIRIDSPDESGTGEILLQGPSVFSGYIDNPAENAKAFTKDGFFRTGDLGNLDADGFLRVSGRAKEVIVLGGGKNIYPEEVEKKYLASSDITEIGVLERRGELVAIVVPDLAAIAKRGSLQTDEAIKTALSSVAKTLPSTQRLSGFVLTREKLPRTLLGKIQRFLLPDLYESLLSRRAMPASRDLTPEERDWVSAESRSGVWALLRRQLEGRPFDLDSHLQLDLGLDSFDWMTLALSIEEQSGVQLDAANIAQIETVRDLLQMVGSEIESRPERTTAAPVFRVDQHRKRWLAPQTGLERAIGRLVLALNRVLMRTVFRLKCRGAELLPADGAFVICANHVSDMDPAALAAALPSRVRGRTYWAGDVVRLFASRVTRLLCRSARVYPIDETAPMVAVELAVDVLDAGGVQVWFPEGWRSADGKLLRFQAGIGRILQRANVRVVPAFIAGTLEAWPRESRLPRPHPVEVVFGAPIEPARLVPSGPLSEAPAEQIAAALRSQVGELALSAGADVLTVETESPLPHREQQQ